MWLIDSSSWSQRVHVSRCGSPRLARRSDVQHLSRRASHAKNLHCEGALDFQVRSAVGATSLAQNFAAYADRTVNCPLSSQDQKISSCMSSVGSQATTSCHNRRNSCKASSPRFGPTSWAHAPSSMASPTVRLLRIRAGVML